MVNDMTQEKNGISPEENEATVASFEDAIAQHDQQRYYLRLYLAGSTSRSLQSLKNLKTICEDYLQGRYELEVIDVYQTQLKDDILAVLTLIKQLPLPIRRIIGDLSDTEKVLAGLDLIPR